MTLKELEGLSRGSEVTLRDRREGVLLGIHEYNHKNNLPFVIVSLPNKNDPYSHDELLWPAQVTS